MVTSELIAAIAAETGRPVQQIKSIVRKTINKIRDQIASGDDVVLHGLGTLRVVERKAKVGRHWSTGEPVAIPTRSAVKFVPVADLLEPKPVRKPAAARPKRDGLGWTREV